VEKALTGLACWHGKGICSEGWTALPIKDKETIDPGRFSLTGVDARITREENSAG
jgi:hypothetical protein